MSVISSSFGTGCYALLSAKYSELRCGYLRSLDVVPTVVVFFLPSGHLCQTGHV